MLLSVAGSLASPWALGLEAACAIELYAQLLEADLQGEQDALKWLRVAIWLQGLIHTDAHACPLKCARRVIIAIEIFVKKKAFVTSLAM